VTHFSRTSPLIKQPLATIEWVIMSSHPRVRYRDVPGASEILTPDFLDFLAGLDDAMRDQIATVRAARAERLRQALQNNTPPASLPPQRGHRPAVAGTDSACAAYAAWDRDLRTRFDSLDDGSGAQSRP